MPSPAPRHVTVLAVVVMVSGLAAGCADPVDPATVDLDLSAYPPCPQQPAPPPLPDIDGLVLPPDAEVFTTTEVGPLVQVAGVVPLTPLESRAFYEDHADLQVITAEDERIETEILVTDGVHRSFVKVQITCDGGSNFTATVGEESDAGALPTPQGRPGG